MTTWRLHGGAHCGGGTSSGVHTVADCQALCENTAGCAGFVYAAANFSWTPHFGHNCYNGHGATELVLPSAPDASTGYQMALAECQTQCLYVDGCDGITRSPIDGTCFARGDVDIARCDAGSVWDTYTLVAGAGSGECWQLASVNLSQCDTMSEGFDTYVREPSGVVL